MFAAAFATQNNWSTFLVGLAASLGAGISMAFAEALSDDGSVTGRGAPVIRGAVCGLMTTAGGLGHSLPFLVPNSWPHAFWTATTIAGVVVFFELWAIAYIRARYMDTPLAQGGGADRRRRRHRAGGRHLHRRRVRARPMFRLAHLSDAHIGPLPRPKWRELHRQARDRLHQLATRPQPRP